MKRAAGLIVLQDNKILMVERAKFGSKIAIPGGKLEPNEFAIEAALRETFEETGIVCYVPHEDNCFFSHDVDGFGFSSWVAKPIAGSLISSEEGKAFWLELSIFKKVPNILHFPKWSAEAIRYFKL
jgi:8-oxo-dGTP pyrophosphatase MutT (NUDIX family)